METIKKYGLLKLLGVVFFTQAMTSLIGGSIAFGPFESNAITNATMGAIANNTLTIYISIFLQMVTAVVIIVLGAIMYLTSLHINKALATIALCFYVLEAGMITVSQIFVFALSETSQLYLTSGNTSLVSLSNIFLSCKEFNGKMAMIPFGLGALVFYYLLMKAEILPKWLALWGIITVPFILVGAPLMAFGVPIPFALLIPYVPFEFFTGIFIWIKYSKKATKRLKETA